MLSLATTHRAARSQAVPGASPLSAGVQDYSNTVSICVDKVDGDVSIAIYEGDDMYDGPCLTKETALALCAALKSELEKL